MDADGVSFDHDEAERTLRSWVWQDGDDLLTTLAKQGSEGVALLMTEYPRRKDPHVRLEFVWAPGAASSEAAIAELRKIARANGAGTGVCREAAYIALANALKGGATADLAKALGDRDPGNRWTAMICLAEVGTDEAWDSALATFEKAVRQPSKIGYTPPRSVAAVCYLGRFVSGLERRNRLVSLVRGQWGKLPQEDRWILQYLWPGLEPTGPDPDALDPPDLDRLRLGIDLTSYTSGPLKSASELAQ